MNEISLDVLKVLASAVVFAFGAGFALGRLIYNKEYKHDTLEDTCLTPRSHFGNKPYKIKRFFANGKCKDVVCDFLEENKKCNIKIIDQEKDTKCNFL